MSKSTALYQKDATVQEKVTRVVREEYKVLEAVKSVVV